MAFAKKNNNIAMLQSEGKTCPGCVPDSTPKFSQAYCLQHITVEIITVIIMNINLSAMDGYEVV
jgi:CheY-like chemotaxis protein